MAKGDKVSVWLRGISDVGGSLDTVASQNGRTVTAATETDSGVKWLVVSEVTRGGTVVKESKFLVSDVVAYVRAVKETQ